MIPTVLLFGLVVGRFWAVPAGAVLWVALVAATTDPMGNMALAAALGAANGAVAVAVRKTAAVLIAETRLRSRN